MATIRFTRDTRAAESDVMHYEGDTLEVTPESAQRWYKRGAAEMMGQTEPATPSGQGAGREGELRAQGVRALRKIARGHGISVSGASKEQLVQAITAAEAGPPANDTPDNDDPALEALLQESDEALRDHAAELGIEEADALGRDDLAVAIRDARRRFGDEADGPEGA